MAGRSGARRDLLRLWGVHARLDFMWVTRDLGSFLLYTISDLVYAVASVVGTWLLAQRFDGIGVWGRDQVLFMLGYAMTVRGLPDMLTNYNVLHLSRIIGRGQLDHILLQPRPVWMALLTGGFVPWSGALYVVPGLVTLGVAAHRVAPAAWPLWAALVALNVAASTVVLLSYSALWSTLAFRYPMAAEEISSRAVDMMTEMRGFPLERMGRVLGGALVTVVPVAFLAWIPCRTLAGISPSIAGLAATPVAALLFGLAAVWAFRAGMAHYLLTGSQRYLTHGHRR